MASNSTPSEDNTVSIRPKRRWFRRLFVTVVLLVGLVVAAHWGVGHVAERKLNRQVALLRAAGEPMLPSEIARLDADSVPDADNAAMILRAAAASVDEQSEAWKAYEALETEWHPLGLRPPFAEDEVRRLRAVVDANRQALAAVSKAATKSGVDWKLEFKTPTFFVELKDLTPQRRLAQLLGMAAWVAHQEGNDAEALRRVREMLFISRAVDRQPTLVSHLVSIGISALATERLTQIAPELRVAAEGESSDGKAASAAQVRELIAELLDDRPVHQGRKRALRGERAMQLDAATGLAYGTIPFNGNGVGWGGTSSSGQGSQAFSSYVIKPIALNDAMIMVRYCTSIIDAGEADDLAALRSRLPKFPAEIEKSPRLHFVAGILTPSFARAIEHDFRNMAGRHMAATALAARWYATEHDGKLPGRLEELSPKYLPKVPVDPMAAGGKPLAYLTGDRPAVYSVGENGRDDGGKEPSPTATRRQNSDTSDDLVRLKTEPRPPKPKEPEEAPEGPPAPANAPDESAAPVPE